MIFTVKYSEDKESKEGHILAEIPELPVVMAYGHTKEEAFAKVQESALRGLALMLKSGVGYTAKDLTQIEFREAA